MHAPGAELAAELERRAAGRDRQVARRCARITGHRDVEVEHRAAEQPVAHRAADDPRLLAAQRFARDVQRAGQVAAPPARVSAQVTS